MYDTREPGDVVLADALFDDYFIACELRQRGIDLVARAQYQRVGTQTAESRPDGDIIVWQRPNKPHGMSGEQYRSRKAVEITERYAEGLADATTLTDAHERARAAFTESKTDTIEWVITATACDVAILKDAMEAAVSTTEVADVIAHLAVFDWDDPTWVEYSGEPPPAYAARRSTERASLCRLLRCIIGNPFRPVSLDRAWQRPAVTDLAQAAYDNRTLPADTLDPERLAVLADALEESGCDNADILEHLRGPGPHVRGCHLLDLILSKDR